MTGKMTLNAMIRRLWTALPPKLEEAIEKESGPANK
jgi:hypothetical protein